MSVVRAQITLPAGRDSALLAYAADRELVLATRNVQDFLRLNEQWTTLRDWGPLRRPHSGILLCPALVSDADWGELVGDLLLHPNCPRLEDQLLIWQPAAGTWEVDRPYASQRRQTVRL